MTDETIYSAAPELRQPGRLFAAAGEDLRRSGAVAWQLFRRNLQARYRRAWLGYLWLLLPTVGTTLVWVYVHATQVVRIAPTAMAYPVYVLAGTVLWQVFVDALNAPLQQFTAGRQMITRSRVPHEALVLSGLLEVLFNTLPRLLVLAAAIPLFGERIAWTVVLVPAGVAALALFGTMLGLFLAPVGLLYDDVGRGVLLVTGLWFFLTPVIYPVPARGHASLLVRLNPVTPLIDTTRGWLTSGTASVHAGFAPVVAVTIPLLALAWLFHRLARPHVIARLG